MGQWIYDQPKHVHDHPGYDTRPRPLGSVWQCACGEWFKLIECTGSGMQWDYSYTFKWQHIPKGTEVVLNNGEKRIAGQIKPIKPYSDGSYGGVVPR